MATAHHQGYQTTLRDAWPFGTLMPLSYGLIMADPPWTFATYSPKGHGKSAQKHYGCLSLADINALPVSQLAAPDCMLMLWATSPMLDVAFTTMAAWGFRYVSQGQWIKRTTGGKLAFGTGYRMRSSSEPFLLGTIGNPKNSRSHRNVIDGLRREHSRKPEEAYAWAETYLPNARRAELFLRTPRPGWDGWGNETEKFKQKEAMA